MVIAVHSCDYGVKMPDFTQRILMRGYLGVDIFLFLSGIGCYYSLSKNESISKWYKKRFVRIFIPYTLIQIPFWVYQFSIGEFNIEKQLINFSTIGFWLHHVGAWYVALLIPLYLFTPPIYKLLLNGQREIKAVTTIIIIYWGCNIDFGETIETLSNILHNLQWAFSRVPSFIVGMYLAPFIKNKYECKATTSTIAIIGLLFLYAFVNWMSYGNISLHWCLVLPLCICFAMVLDKIKTSNVFRSITWVGFVSLESYLANIYLCGTIKDITNQMPQEWTILHGRYLEYALIIAFGLILSYAVHTLSARLSKPKTHTQKAMEMDRT